MAQDVLETMLAAWHHHLKTGSETARDVALELADANRAKAKEERK